MTAFRRSLRCLGAVALLSLPVLAAGEAQVTVLDGTPGNTLIRCELGGFSTEPVDIGGTAYLGLSVDREGVIREVGAPELPRVCRSIIIPDDAAMTVRVHDVNYRDIPGVLIAPSRGAIPRDQDPASVPYGFRVLNLAAPIHSRPVLRHCSKGVGFPTAVRMITWLSLVNTRSILRISPLRGRWAVSSVSWPFTP